MIDQQGILQAVFDDPDDVTHRLVYADWLDEHDQPLRAGFIRAQCALDPFLSPLADEGSRAPSSIEMMHLRPDLRAALLEPFHGVAEDIRVVAKTLAEIHEVLQQRFSFHVRGGFIEKVEVHGGKAVAAFVRQLPHVFRQTPILRLILTRKTPRQAGLTTVIEDDPVGLYSIRSLVSQPEAARLRCLDLRNLGLGDDLAATLLRSRYLTSLRQLFLDNNDITGTFADELQDRFGIALVLTPFDPNADIPF